MLHPCFLFEILLARPTMDRTRDTIKSSENHMIHGGSEIYGKRSSQSDKGRTPGIGNAVQIDPEL